MSWVNSLSACKTFTIGERRTKSGAELEFPQDMSHSLLDSLMSALINQADESRGLHGIEAFGAHTTNADVASSSLKLGPTLMPFLILV